MVEKNHLRYFLIVLHPGTSVLHHHAKPQLVEVQIEEHMSQDTALPGKSRPALLGGCWWLVPLTKQEKLSAFSKCSDAKRMLRGIPIPKTK